MSPHVKEPPAVLIVPLGHNRIAYRTIEAIFSNSHIAKKYAAVKVGCSLEEFSEVSELYNGFDKVHVSVIDLHDPMCLDLLLAVPAGCEPRVLVWVPVRENGGEIALQIVGAADRASAFVCAFQATSAIETTAMGKQQERMQAALFSSSIAYTTVRSAPLLENFVLGSSVQQGVLKTPIRLDAVIAPVALHDAAACLASALTNTRYSHGKRLDITGPQSLTVAELAKELGLEPKLMPWADVRARMIQMTDVFESPAIVDYVLEQWKVISSESPLRTVRFPTDDCQDLTGSDGLTVAEWGTQALRDAALAVQERKRKVQSASKAAAAGKEPTGIFSGKLLHSMQARRASPRADVA